MGGGGAMAGEGEQPPVQDPGNPSCCSKKDHHIIEANLLVLQGTRLRP